MLQCDKQNVKWLKLSQIKKSTALKCNVHLNAAVVLIQRYSFEYRTFTCNGVFAQCGGCNTASSTGVSGAVC